MEKITLNIFMPDTPDDDVVYYEIVPSVPDCVATQVGCEPLQLKFCKEGYADAIFHLPYTTESWTWKWMEDEYGVFVECR